MPKLSPTMEEGMIVKWHKSVGDLIKADELLMEVATDKATVEYNALDQGYLRQTLVLAGESAIVNQAVAIFTETKDESIEGYKPTGVTKAVAESKPAEVELSDKVASSSPKPAEAAPSGKGMQQPSFVPEAPLEGYTFEWPTQAIEKRTKASPLARKLAGEKGLDLSTVKGSGPDQRIVSRDLERAQPASAVAFGHREEPVIAPGTYEEEALTPMRKVIGNRLQESKTFIPHFYVQQAIDAQPLVAIREQLSTFKVKVSVNDLILRATALSLREHPHVNSGFNSVTQSVIRFKTVDLSVAVSVGGGLITPIIRHADFKNLGEISVEVRALAKRAKDGKLEPHEYKGGSFTVSNLGMYGISNFQAIINPPQAAILAISSIQDLPVIKNGAIVPGKIINFTLSADHRVIDGVVAAEFLKTLQKYLENPAGLLI
jgi:pyruvate dehydrogenase E2 component (dihydrolipoamide acetyltransferase)